MGSVHMIMHVLGGIFCKINVFVSILINLDSAAIYNYILPPTKVENISAIYAGVYTKDLIKSYIAFM